MSTTSKQKGPADQVIGGPLMLNYVLDVLLLPASNDHVALLYKKRQYRPVVDHENYVAWPRH